jgi:hypothetical protein
MSIIYDYDAIREGLNRLEDAKDIPHYKIECFHFDTDVHRAIGDAIASTIARELGINDVWAAGVGTIADSYVVTNSGGPCPWWVTPPRSRS